MSRPTLVPMIKFQQVSKRYAAGFDALIELSFEVNPGELVFVTGASGAGKSTLFKLIASMEKPTRGQVLVNGNNLGQLPRSAIPRVRRGIGLVFQDHRLLMDRTVFDNVALPLVIAGVSREDVGKRVRAALDKVGLLSKERSAPLTLSAGEQQRVGIARAIVGRPSLIIADEPTGNLDPKLSSEIMRLFVEFQQAGSTVLIASHDLTLVRQFGKRVMVLSQGRLSCDYRAPGAS